MIVMIMLLVCGDISFNLKDICSMSVLIIMRIVGLFGIDDKYDNHDERKKRLENTSIHKTSKGDPDYGER